METITPPTDSLYKFIAVAGIAMVIATFIWPYRTNETLESTRDQIAKTYGPIEVRFNAVASDASKFHDIESEAKQLSFLIKQLDSFEKDRKAKNRKSYIDADFDLERSISLNIDNTLAVVSRPPTPSAFRKYAKREQTMSKWELCCEITAQDFDKFLETMTAEEIDRRYGKISEEALAVRVEASKACAEINNMMHAANRQAEQETLAFWVRFFGGLITIIGMVAWYFKVQHFQDLLIKSQALKAQQDLIQRN